MNELMALSDVEKVEMITDLREKLRDALDRNDELEIENNDLQVQLDELGEVNDGLQYHIDCLQGDIYDDED